MLIWRCTYRDYKHYLRKEVKSELTCSRATYEVSYGHQKHVCYSHLSVPESCPFVIEIFDDILRRFPVGTIKRNS